jgi:hypothetical protein
MGYLSCKTPYDFTLMLYNITTNSTMEKRVGIIEQLYPLRNKKYLLLTEKYNDYKAPYILIFEIWSIEQDFLTKKQLNCKVEWEQKYLYAGQYSNTDILMYDVNEQKFFIVGSKENEHELPQRSFPLAYLEYDNFIFLIENKTISMLQ